MQASDPLRVAFVAGTLGVGGAEKQLVYTARALQDAGARVAVFAFGPEGGHAVSLRECGVPVQSIGRIAQPAGRLLVLVKALHGFAPDLIQATHFYVNLYVALAGRLLRRPALGAVRSNLLHEFRANPFWGRWLYRLPRTIVANSRSAIRNAEALGLDAGKLKLVTNVTAIRQRTEMMSITPHAGDDRVIAVAVGNLHRVKRFDRFIDALALATHRCPNLKGVIVGSGPEQPALEAHASARKLGPDRLTFLGHREDVSACLRAADFLCLTSEEEGCPNVILEAMAEGLPVIATRVGDVPEVVEDGGTGYVVEQDDVELLAERMMTLVESPDLRRRLGEAGRQRVVREFSPARLLGDLLRVYREVSDGRRDGALVEKLAALTASH